MDKIKGSMSGAELFWLWWGLTAAASGGSGDEDWGSGDSDGLDLRLVAR